MQFEWDEAKRLAIIGNRCVDILHAALIFENRVLTRIDNRKDYGEQRLISICIVDEECFVVVHTERTGVTRLITAWKGGRNDRAQLEASLAR